MTLVLSADTEQQQLCALAEAAGCVKIGLSQGDPTDEESNRGKAAKWLPDLAPVC